MRFNYRKIASVLASAAMLTSTVGFAAAASFPAPFSSTGGAVVYGADGLKSDIIAAIKVANQVKATTAATATSATSTGETVALFTGSSKININDGINGVLTVLTASELPTVLEKKSFSGNVDATITQTINIGSKPSLIYAKQPTSSDDPVLGFNLSTSTSNYLYNATASFSKAVNFTHADSKNNEIELFGQKYTVGSATSTTDLILFKSSSKLNFDSSGTTSEEVTIEGKSYTVELVSASTSTATIKVTDEAGTSEQKQITTGNSKKTNGVTIAVITADSNNLKYTASISAGADKLTLTSGSAVTVGDSATNIDGTLVTINGGTVAATKITISVTAESSEKDAIVSGGEFTDPVFGSFKISMAGGVNIEADSSSRENITITSSGDDKLQVKLMDKDGDEAAITFVKSRTTMPNAELQADDDGKNITVLEGGPVFKNEFVVLGNEEYGFLLKVAITNSTSATDYSADRILFTNVFDSTETFESVESAEGTGTVTIGGKVYSLKYYANDVNNQDKWNVSIDFPDSDSGAKELVIFPTFRTSLGANAFFYENTTIDLGAYTKGSAAVTELTTIKIPDGDGYQSIALTSFISTDQANEGIWGIDGTNLTTNATSGGVAITVGNLVYHFNATGTINQTTIKLANPSGGAAIVNPAFGILEEKDDNSAYHAVIVTTTSGTTSTNATRVNSIVRTWGSDAVFNAITHASDSDIASEIDLYGTIGSKDSGDSNRPKAILQYPDEQIFANVYVGETDSVVTPGAGGGSATGGLTAIEDSLIASYEGSNLIVVGGSCVNKVAAKILDSEDPICGADFTTKTTVGATQYIIKTVASPYNADKIAVLVAGYEAADTVSAVDALIAGADTTVDTESVYPELTTE